MQESKKQLKPFTGRNWSSWKQHFKGHYSGRKTASGRTFWEVINGDDPRDEGRLQVKTPIESQVQRKATVQGAEVGMVDQTGAAVFDTVYNEVSTDEDIGVYEGRCKEWGDVTEEVWASLLSACTDEPATMLDNVADKDGKAAWNKFLARWNSVSISTIMAGLEQLLDYHPKNASMAQHVTGWEDLIRKLKEWKVPLGELPALESMLFLRTLPAKYNDFINHKKLQGAAS